MSKERLAKKASKLLVKLYAQGVNELSIDTGQEAKLVVFIRPVNAVTARLKEHPDKEFYRN